MVDKVVGEELSEPILEARLDVILEVKLDAKGYTVENTEFCIYTNITSQDRELPQRSFHDTFNQKTHQFVLVQQFLIQLPLGFDLKTIQNMAELSEAKHPRGFSVS